MSALIIVMFSMHCTQLNKQLGKQDLGGGHGSGRAGLCPPAMITPFMITPVHSFPYLFIHSLASQSLIHSLSPSFTQISLYSFIHLFIHLSSEDLFSKPCDRLQGRCQEGRGKQNKRVLAFEKLTVWWGRQTTNTCNEYK